MIFVPIYSAVRRGNDALYQLTSDLLMNEYPDNGQLQAAVEEKTFQQNWLNNSIEVTRTGLCLLSVLLLTMAWHYSQIVTRTDNLYWVAMVILMPVCAALISIFYPNLYIRIYPLFIRAVILASCFGLFLLTPRQHNIEVGYFIMALTLFILWIHVFARLDLPEASQWSGAITMIYAMAIFHNQGLSDGDIAMNIGIVLIANIGGMTVSYDREKLAWRLFHNSRGPGARG